MFLLTFCNFVFLGFYSLLSAVFLFFMVASSMGFCGPSGNREINMMMITSAMRVSSLFSLLFRVLNKFSF